MKLNQFCPSPEYRKLAPKCKKLARSTLLAKNYSYNPTKKEWKCRKNVVEECDILVEVIQWSQKNNTFCEHGLFAEELLTESKTLPEFTYSYFIKSKTTHDRGSRISGIELFASYCRYADISIIGSLSEFVAKNSLLVKRLYDLLANGVSCVRKRARIFGKLCSSVFIGWDLKDDDESKPLTVNLTVGRIQINSSWMKPTHPSYRHSNAGIRGDIT